MKQVNMDVPSCSRILRKNDEIFLIGSVKDQILGCKLPSNRQVLSVLLFKLRRCTSSLRESASLLFDEVADFWQKARIPIKKKGHCIEKIENLYGTWRSLQKNASRQSEIEKKKREKFVDELDDLFDIAHIEALKMISIEEDKLFLVSQRQKGRPGSMQGIDMTLALTEKRKEDRMVHESERRKRSYEEIETLSKFLLKLHFF